MELKDVDDLKELYFKVTEMRAKVLELVQEYGYTANSLVSRTFEHDIEILYGRRKLNEDDVIY